jgi:hypothetical protein
MSKLTTYVKDSLTTSPVLSTLWQQYLMMSEGTIITIPPFLQRYLQKQAWMKQNFKKAKEYNHSALSATSLFEPFILVSVELLIKNLSSDIKQWEKDGKSEISAQANIVLKEITDKKNKGAKWAKIDGQSRNILALKPFFESEISLDKSLTFKQCEVDDEGNTLETDFEYDAKGKLFKDMPIEVKEYIQKVRAFVVQIVDGNINNIVKSLIAKQQGIKFTKWQEIYHGKVISVFANRIERYITKPIIDGYKKYITQNDKYRAEWAGLELFFATLSTFFKYKEWPSDAKLESIMNGTEDVPSEKQIKMVKDNVQLYLDYFGTIPEKDVQKYPSKVLQNFVIFNWYLGNSQNKESFFSQYNLPKCKVISPNNWVKTFIEMHEYLTDNTNLDQYEIIDGVAHRRQPSYPAGNNNDKTNLVEWRIDELSKRFKELLPELVRKNIITTENIKMPDMNTIKSANGFTTMDGEDVDPRKKYHKGHEKSKFNKGSNAKENLAPQDPKDNLQYNKRNVVK